MRSNTVDLQPIIASMFRDGLSKVNTCLVGKIVNTDNLKNGFVTVKPLINYVAGSLETTENPNIGFIPVIMPSTTTAGIVVPVKVGDTCLLLFGQKSFDQFKLGTDTPHDVIIGGNFDINNAVALVGFNITQESVWNPNNHSEDYSETSVKVYNNKGTPNECFIEMLEDGGVNVTSPTEINANAPVVNADDVVIRDVGSVKQFMLKHTHNYTDDSNPMVTAPPNI